MVTSGSQTKLTDYGLRNQSSNSTFGSNTLERRSKLKQTGNKIIIPIKNLYYPGFPAIPLMDMAHKYGIREVNHAGNDLRKYIRGIGSFSTRKRSDLKGKGSEIHQSGKPFKSSKYGSGTKRTTGGDTKMYANKYKPIRQSKKDTLQFSMFFNKSSFDTISKEISNLIYDKANRLLATAVVNTVRQTREKIKRGKSAVGVTVGKLPPNKFRPTVGYGANSGGRIYSTLANSLQFFEKDKGILNLDGRPISPLVSYGIGSFDTESTGRYKTSSKNPTGVFGSRMGGAPYGGSSSKSLTELYARKVSKFKAKSSPLGGYESLKQRG